MPSTWNNGPIGMVVRLVLVILTLLCLWAANGRFLAWRDDYSSNFRSDVGLWTAYLAWVALAGIAFGLAVALPNRMAGYRWVRAFVLALTPLVVLVVGSLFHAPRLLNQLPNFLSGLAFEVLFVPISAFMLGAAVAAGFAEPRGAR